MNPERDSDMAPPASRGWRLAHALDADPGFGKGPAALRSAAEAWRGAPAPDPARAPWDAFAAPFLAAAAAAQALAEPLRSSPLASPSSEDILRAGAQTASPGSRVASPLPFAGNTRNSGTDPEAEGAAAPAGIGGEHRPEAERVFPSAVPAKPGKENGNPPAGERAGTGAGSGAYEAGAPARGPRRPASPGLPASPRAAQKRPFPILPDAFPSGDPFALWNRRRALRVRAIPSESGSPVPADNRIPIPAGASSEADFRALLRRLSPQGEPSGPAGASATDPARPAAGKVTPPFPRPAAGGPASASIAAGPTQTVHSAGSPMAIPSAAPGISSIGPLSPENPAGARSAFPDPAFARPLTSRDFLFPPGGFARLGAPADPAAPSAGSLPATAFGEAREAGVEWLDAEDDLAARLHRLLRRQAKRHGVDLP